jgi:hypothetical protein
MSVGVLGKVQGGRVVLDRPIEFDGEALVTVTITYRARDRADLDTLALADGTPVLVSVEPAPARRGAALSEQELLAEPFVGMWKDREDMADSAEWVRKVREQWRQRISPPE